MQKTLLLVFIFLFVGISMSMAQRSGADSPLREKLWYGAGINANFQGGNISSTFSLGLAPMVGYKITENLSFGPRASFLVSWFRTRAFGPTETINPTDWSVGVFGRYKIAREFFAHLEYAFQNEAFIFTDVNGLRTEREVNNAIYVGGGYSSRINDLLGFEVSLNLYVNQPVDDFRNPLNYRFGVN